MNWRSDWLALHDRIAGIEQAFNIFIHGLSLKTGDPYNIGRKVFRPEFTALLATIREFRVAHATVVPSNAVATIDRFLSTHGSLVGSNDLDNTGHLVASVTALTAFRTELTFQLTNRDASRLRATERALQHLQRSIVADRTVRDRWTDAFDQGETTCEALGATHLLGHGIWAFKVSASGERTDLVYNEPLSDLDGVAMASDSLVLTEWKVVRSALDLQTKIDAATRQVDRYSAGVLAGLELVNSRFIIVVSSDRLQLPPDVSRNAVTYRVRGIAVAPASPSKARH